MAQKGPKRQKAQIFFHAINHQNKTKNTRHPNFFSHPITENVNENCLRRILTKLIFGRVLYKDSSGKEAKSTF